MELRVGALLTTAILASLIALNPAVVSICRNAHIRS